jgi:hypothetical protein
MELWGKRWKWEDYTETGGIGKYGIDEEEGKYWRAAQILEGPARQSQQCWSLA